MPPLPAREKILRCARSLFAEHGLDGVSVRDICDATGLNVSLVSYHFGGKEGLYKTIIEEHFLAVRSRLEETLERDGRKLDALEFLEKIRGFISLLVNTRLQSPEISMIIQRERLNGLPFCHDIYEEIMSPIAENLIDLVRTAQKQKIVRKNFDPTTYFISLIESVFGYFVFSDCKLTFNKGALQLPRDKDAYIDFMARLYTEGIMA